MADALDRAGVLERDGDEAPRRRWIVLDALRITLGRPPVWLVVWALEALLAIAPAAMFHAWMSRAIAHRYEPGSLVANLDTVFRIDQRRSMDLLDGSTGELGAVLAVLAMLLGCFCAGGWLRVFLERTHGHSLQRFFLGGARYFWRFFRVMLFAIAVLALVSWVVYGPPWDRLVLEWWMKVAHADVDKLETLSSESTVTWLRWTQQGLYAIGFALVLTWGDFTRTRLALHDTSSAVWAGLCTWFTLARHPLRTLGPVAGLFVVEAVLVFAAGILARNLEGRFTSHPDLYVVGLLLLIGQIVLVWRVVLRGARYNAAIAVSREVVRPIARPDPWKESFGPPTGPRYPIGGDEYGMSL